MEKKCFKCGLVKPINMFYKHKMMADGHVNKCKECNKKDVRLNRLDKIEYYRNYDSLRSANEGRAVSRALYTWWYRNAFPDKYAAHKAVGNAVRDGKLFKPANCPTCGDFVKAREMHAHHNDYSKPLDVEWLCVRCHAKKHPREDWY